MKRIVMTGGGTAGHVTPNIALLPALKEAGYDIRYIGSYNGIEKDLIEAQGIPYTGIDSGKLRRYLDIKNFLDPFRVLHGYAQALGLLRKMKPDIVFSKGASYPFRLFLQPKPARFRQLSTNPTSHRDLPISSPEKAPKRYAATSQRP